MKICVLTNFVWGHWGMMARPEIGETYLKHFPSMGHHVIVIEWDREKEQAYRVNDRAYVQTFRWPNASLFVGRLFQNIVAACKKFGFLLQRIHHNECDVIIVEDDVPSYVISLCLRKIMGVPFVFYDASPDPQIMIHKSSIGHYRNPFLYSIIGGFLMRVERFLAKRADKVFAQSGELRGFWMKSGIDPDKIVVLPNGAPMDIYWVVSKEDVTLAQHSSMRGPLIIYVGSIDKLRRLDVLIRAFALLNHSVPECSLLMVGEGNDEENLSAMAKHLNVEDKVNFVGVVPYSEVPKYLAMADVAACPIPPIPIYAVSSPLKLYEYMAAGKPVLATMGVPECERALTESECGILCDFEVESIARGFERLLTNFDQLDNMGKKGREWVLANRSYEVIACKAEKELLKLLG